MDFLADFASSVQLTARFECRRAPRYKSNKCKKKNNNAKKEINKQENKPTLSSLSFPTLLPSHRASPRRARVANLCQAVKH